MDGLRTQVCHHGYVSLMEYVRLSIGSLMGSYFTFVINTIKGNVWERLRKCSVCSLSSAVSVDNAYKYIYFFINFLIQSFMPSAKDPHKYLARKRRVPPPFKSKYCHAYQFLPCATIINTKFRELFSLKRLYIINVNSIILSHKGYPFRR